MINVRPVFFHSLAIIDVRPIRVIREIRGSIFSRIDFIARMSRSDQRHASVTG